MQPSPKRVEHIPPFTGCTQAVKEQQQEAEGLWPFDELDSHCHRKADDFWHLHEN